MKEKSDQCNGLYVPQLEKDACGIGLIANLNGIRSNQIVKDSLTILENMEHRGACGCEPNSGDGAGILIHIPHEFLQKKLSVIGVNLPARGTYGVGNFFFPKKVFQKEKAKRILEKCAADFKFEVIGYRKVTVNNQGVGHTALSTEPDIVQIFFVYPDKLPLKILDRKLYLLRKHISTQVHVQIPELRDDFYTCSLSSRIIIYKGQLTSQQVREYFTDLSDPDFKSAIAIVHSRFSTNTVPKWRLAQPFRCISHNGEINTIQGNINWWKAREKTLSSKHFTAEELDIIFPVTSQRISDSANFDSVLEFLMHSGRTIPNALMMMIPEAWQNYQHLSPSKKAFYEYHESLMEPWDGPASMCFTDGTLVGATLDRNGLRPSRYMLTDDNVLILGSETGVLPVDPAKVVLKDRLEPGKILIADLDEGRIIKDEELKEIITHRENYLEWSKDSNISIHELGVRTDMSTDQCEVDFLKQQISHGISREDVNLILNTMVTASKEPIHSMGADIPLAVLSKQAQHISNYFKQQFAQVTNPPIDPLREKDFMTLKTYLGGSKNILELHKNTSKYIRLNSPILSTATFNQIRKSKHPFFTAYQLNATFNVQYREGDLENRLKEICSEVESAIKSGCTTIVISNRMIQGDLVPIPSLLTTGTLHHYLINKGLRQTISLIVEGGDLLEVHHFATLVSYGADAIYPGLSYELIDKLCKTEDDLRRVATDQLQENYKEAVEKGLLKVMSKLGVSTLLSYKGAQTFEALGLASEVIDLCFSGTISRIEGMTFDMLAKEALAKHKLAFREEMSLSDLPDTGMFQWKRRGEYHLFNPTTIHLLQHSTQTNNYSIFKKYTEAINNQAAHHCTLRSLFTFKKGNAISLNEVESVESILSRFATGAMSFGSISHEAHTTLAIAMNRIGGKSNSGEGGEDESRFKKMPNGDWERSAIKQVASGRFGVTIHYLSNANEIQIKMAQGAKPGEGGQLPGHKVDEWIAKVRHSTPGVGLISPPPHHDIYSIEDLAQLIYDLKNANRNARISVKLVSKAGVGIIASGVAKGHADHILISGHDGGTGASPLSSIHRAGLPWELGLAETHQALVKNKLRDRVTLQTDGQIRTGRDMAIATLLGAEEWGIATAALVVEGCILMRKCHLNTCPVGIATQNKELRKKFAGKVEDLVNYFHFLAQDLREIMAELGFKTVDEMVGQSQMLEYTKDVNHWKLENLDLSPILYKEKNNEIRNYKSIPQDHGIDQVLDRKLIEYSKNAIGDKVSFQSIFPINNRDRAVGTMLSNEIAKKHGSKGLPDGSISFRFRGSAGQSFGAFGAAGLNFTLEGDTNDYFGKGLSGGRLIMVPDRNSILEPSENVIVGNVALYGATSGEAYIKGKAGERFAVRNSGVIAVVEGVGAHGCEYMTGGRVVILGKIGRNFAAGMSGGVAYILNPKEIKEYYINRGMVDLDAPSKKDMKEVRTIIRNHFRYTGSIKALELLQDWETYKHQFLKVIPTEYKAVLAKLRKVKLQKTV